MTEAAVSFAGNLTEDPEVRDTDGGIARAMFRVAVSGRGEQEASFFTVVVWRDQAEHAAQSLSKGSRVVVMGRLQQRSWTAEDGSARSVVSVLVRFIVRRFSTNSRPALRAAACGGRPRPAPLPVDLAGQVLVADQADMDLHGAQGSGGRIGLVNLAGIGSPTWSSSLVGFLELAGGQPRAVPLAPYGRQRTIRGGPRWARCSPT
jgi:single-strand DNA-binding protein